MNIDKRVSFFEDNSKNEEFKNRLIKMLSKEDSNILNCILQYSSSNNLILFFKLKNAKSDFRMEKFDFYSPLHRDADIGKREESCYEYFKEEGLRKDEVDELFDILDDFTFKNFYEGQFFASKFIDFEDRSKKNRLFFKYTPQEKDNEYEINGSIFEKATGIVGHTELLRLLNIQNKTIFCGMMPINPWRVINECKIEEAPKCIESRQNYYKESFYLIEYYKNIELVESFLFKVYELSENELIETKKFK